jgi:hypothetical protein
MSEENAVENSNVAPAEAQAESSAPELTVNDLNAIKQIIDVASSRGAFKPNEMAVVGTTYNKLEQFLAAVASQQGQTQGE